MDSRIRQYTIIEMVSEAFRIYSENFLVIASVYLLPLLPIFAIQSYFEASGQGYTGPRIGFEIFFQFMSILLFAPITVAVSDACLGNKSTISRSFKRVLEIPGKLFLTYLAYMALLAVGLLLLVVPGAVFAMYCGLCLTIVVLERRSPVQALKRSARLVRGAFWKLAGVTCIQFMIFLIYLALLVLIVTVLQSQFSWPTDSLSSVFISTILISLVLPLLFIPWILFYYDQRVQKEDYDAAALMQDLRS